MVPGLSSVLAYLKNTDVLRDMLYGDLLRWVRWFGESGTSSRLGNVLDDFFVDACLTGGAVCRGNSWSSHLLLRGREDVAGSAGGARAAQADRSFERHVVLDNGQHLVGEQAHVQLRFFMRQVAEGEFGD